MPTEWVQARVLVTGAGSGIGMALATEAAARGARVAVVDIEVAAAEAVAQALRANGADARAYACDVTDSSAMDALAHRVGQEMGGLEALFNNAGVGVGGTIDSISAADAMWIVSVNLIGVINGVRSFMPLLRAATSAGRKAWIVNTGSEHSLGVPTFGASNVYTATKHAIFGLTDVLRHDLKGSDIHAAVLCPGLVGTNIFDARRNRPDAFGGPRRMTVEQADKARAMMSTGQAPALTAQLCFEGLARGEFIIITDPKVGTFVRPRLVELERAIDQIERRLA